MLKFLSAGLCAVGLVASATPVLANGHTEALAMDCATRSHFSADECACLVERAGPKLNAAEIGYLISIHNGKPDNLDAARASETPLISMAKVHWFVHTAVPYCKITE